MKFRRLRADEIEVRVAQVADTGSISLLLYKDARCDMNILDETVGSMYWKREHSRDNANCTVSIYNTDIYEWISKEDTGTESYTEAEKGKASDSFKRACVNWGIGRELYTSPAIWIKKGDYEENKKGSTYDRFKVKDIDYDTNGNIVYLVIDNTKLKRTVFTYGSKIAPKNIDSNKTVALRKKCDSEHVDVLKLCNLYSVTSLDELSETQYSNIVNHWSEVKDACAE